MSAQRSFLFTPGNHPRKVEKAFEVGADAVIIDLEDAVALAEKEATRETVVAALQRPRTCRAYVRVNAYDTAFCYGDLVAVIGPGIDGIVLPKLESASTVKSIDWLMGQLEAERGLTVGSLDLMPIIETAAGMAAIADICNAGTRIKRVSFGAGDYHLDLNLVWNAEEAALAVPRAQLVLASRQAGLEPPIDTVVLQIREPERFAASARRGHELGFQGKLCIHPDQVAPTNEIFTPSAADIEHARRVVDAFDAAEANGSASIALDGYFIDYPIVDRARKILDLAAAIQGP